MAPNKSTEEPVAAPASSQEDETMEEDVALQEADAANPAIYNLGDSRIQLLPGGDEFNTSFEFQKEDHTLGNALRYIIMKNPEVDFCGYSIPHPSEALMNIRIQTFPPYTAQEALNKGFEDLIALCDVVADTFTTERNAFAANQESQMQT
ncbi:DNA-directed RNA polymerase [Calycina marina]|uniref:DNA-directed RNA polymerases I and III subunit RPAC2 n=1 Tax=Calycina marina TaxID=1763456 RepID=A0A9P7ZBN4_9HELO|nr:DNA-directed RNA polymerase [Calycina marina]